MNSKFEQLGNLAESIAKDLESKMHTQMGAVDNDKDESDENKAWIKEMFNKAQKLKGSTNPEDHRALINEITNKFK